MNTQTSKRWASICTECERDAELESRLTHGMRALCDNCATKPYKYASATAPASDFSDTADPPKQPAKTTPTKPYTVTWDTSGKRPKLILPNEPAHDDMPGLLAWLTCVLRLHPQHPAISVVRQGQYGENAHVEIRRADAPAIRFEPVGLVDHARKLIPYLRWSLEPTDGKPYGFTNDHCAAIAEVLRLACGACETPPAEQEASAIVGTFIGYAEAIEGFTTYGNTAQRYEAASELIGVDRRPRYLIDENTGEHIIRASDLQEAARSYIGCALHRGWLDGRMEALGWSRVPLDGHQQPGRGGRTGPHQRCVIYRGILPTEPDTDDSVTT